MNTIVSYEVAKMLKNKLFKELCHHYYVTEFNLHFEDFDDELREVADSDCQPHLVLAPTISEVVMWLYEKHGIWIEVIETDLFNKFFFQIKRKDNTRLKNGDYNSPTEAYESAIKYVLTNLI